MSVPEALAELEAKLLASGSVAKYIGIVESIRKAVAMQADEAKVLALVDQLAPPKLDAALRQALMSAVSVGAVSAADLAGVAAESVTVTGATLEIAKGFDVEARDRLAAARALIASGASLDAALAPVFAVQNAATQRITAGVVGAARDGVRAVATEADVPVVWIAETNACVHCLAYSGQVAQPGKKFPGGLTYGAKSYFPDATSGPALHPHCRCYLEPLNDQSYADALKREADRSVLRGFSLASESMSVRIAAAQKLLDEGVNAPKSVQDYARKAIKAGTFSTRGR